MTSIDTGKLQRLIEDYKKSFEQNIPREIYKWKAVKCFQDNWDIEAPDFAEMLSRSLAKTENLLTSAQNFPRKMIGIYADFVPGMVRELFYTLFDETESLEARIERFKQGIAEVHAKWNPEGDRNHYHTESVITTYLWLRYPDKYYIYKPTVAKHVFEALGEKVKLWGAGAAAVVKSYELYDTIAGTLLADSEMRSLLDRALTDDCYPDNFLKTLTVDFCYFVKPKYSITDSIDKHPLFSPKVWMYAPGEGARKWNECVAKGEMCLGWDDLGDLLKYSTRGDMIKRMQKLYGEGKEYKNDSLATWGFAHSVRVGDIVFAKKGRQTIIGRGVVTGEYRYDDARGEYKHIRAVKWDKVGEWRTDEPIVLKTLTDITSDSDYVNRLYALTNERPVVTQVEESQPEEIPAPVEKYTREDFLKDVFMDEKNYNNLVRLLKSKKNIILQGAPGVGKTFSAKRLAYSLMGERDDSRICLVQFHQNYSYEDFIMGYKPHEDTFVLRKGIFYDFCTLAKSNPDKDYYFIIDEINRGNLSKIFGELLMLIEREYRGEKMTLAYNGEQFYVPRRLYIIGMMNTADRSLAMIDYALRRRFGFFEMKPGFDSAGFKMYQSELQFEKFDRLIQTIEKLNEAIKNDSSLGVGFEIGHSYFCGQMRESATDDWLQSIVDFDIIPMLKEYWFDNKSRVEEWSKRLNAAIYD